MARHKDVLSSAEILQRLYDLGYFYDKSFADVKNLAGAALKRAVQAYQRFSGLDPSGRVDERTASLMSRRRCGLPDMQLRADDVSCKWPMKRVTYFSSLTLPGLSEEQIATAYDIACQQWTAVCGIELVRAKSMRTANIYARSGVGGKNGLDSRGGTLGWSDMPCDAQPNSRIRQMYDEAEDWSFNMLVAVSSHEIGHALGLPHLPKGNLMASYYDPNITTPQRGDIREITKYYGNARKLPLTRRPAFDGDGIPAATIDVGGTILINGQPFVLVPKT